MAVSINKLRGISFEFQMRLKTQRIYNSDQLLEATRTPAGRKSVAEKMHVETRLILEWANRADLARVQGIGGVFSDLLEQAGVDTVKELAARRPDNLHAKLVETNTNRRVAGRAPTLKAVEAWVAQARELPKVLEY